MRERHLFERLCVYVCPDGFSSVEFVALECCLRDGGAAVVSEPQTHALTHVVCHPDDYHRFHPGRNERFYAIVRGEWVFRSFLTQHVLPVEKFNADPQLFFSSLVIAAGSIDKDPRKVIDGLITHFGGQIVENQRDTEGATHVLCPEEALATETPSVSDAQRIFQLPYSDADVARITDEWKQWLDERPVSLDFALPGCLAAFLGKAASLDQCQRVSYNWIEECVRRKQHVAELPFSNPKTTPRVSSKASWKDHPEVDLKILDVTPQKAVYANIRATLLHSNGELQVARKASPDRIAAMEEALAGAIVLVAQHIPPQLKEAVSEVLKAAKAKVANVPLGDSYREIVRKVVTNASVVVCRYQSGIEYEEALRQNKRIVSVYWALAGLGSGSVAGGLRDALHRPVAKFGGIPGMQNLVITLSGFNSRTLPTREDVQMAIQATGACVLPVLSRSHSTHLLCYEASGEKFKKAQSWNFDNILSAEWLLQCIVQWKHVPEDDYCMGTRTRKETRSEPDSTVELTTPALAAQKVAHPPMAESSKGNQDDQKANASGSAGETTPTRNESASKTKTDASAGKKAQPASTDESPPVRSRRTSRRSSVQSTEPEPETIPEDFEFQFGKKIKAAVSAKSAQKGKSNQKAKALIDSADENDTGSDAVPDITMVMADEEGAKTKDVEPAVTSKSKAKKITTTRKRKPTESAPTTESNEDEQPEEVSEKKTKATAKKQKVTKAAADTAAPTKSRKAPARATKDSSGRVFLLTGSREESAVNESIVLSVGGTVSTTGRSFDPNCTHIICSELKRTEKFVAGCASGKWILKPSYLKASSAAGYFVAEEEHEWGSAAADVDQMDPRIWPPVAGYWRKERAAGKPGAFEGWRFLVHPKTVPPPEMCERIINASGGEVIPLTKTLDLTATLATSTKKNPVIALVTTDLSSRDVWLKKFKTSKVPCINASFLIDYLTKDQKQRPKMDAYTL
ncbi:hypothetical protein Poli38472_006286 [Pythium oligandrum]|uniref:BRCT domain-containing protein n=1 Tax=Pythium oligandrum TaxID=41045 RepID=A0A8K1FSR7_PYTOL|nr:hypothetical protein Poli38472_006286 [Pythium oligandrum]|eukprot:TMW68818.1 hypothetical protein Poli38472_006286 [Pythium oligandrum]